MAVYVQLKPLVLLALALSSCIYTLRCIFNTTYYVEKYS